jgi:dihydroflavonol-4-reductase
MGEQTIDSGAGADVFLTGATGFIGSHVLRALLGAGYRVRTLVRPGARRLPAHPALTSITGDLLRAGEVTRHMEGCASLVHVAALYSFSPRLGRDIHTINVAGTAGILEAARIAGVAKAVVTSSSATVGPSRDGRLATEDDWAMDETAASRYHHSKVEQERVALAAQVPTVLLLPSTPVGPGDWKPTPSGQTIVDFMKGRIFATLNGGLNLVPVEDVAAAHVTALEHARPGERYLLGGENLLLDELWSRLAAACARRAPDRHIPLRVVLALGWADELRCRVAGWAGHGAATPLVPLEGVRMANHRMWIDDAKARAELNFRPGSVTSALQRAVRWYHDHGYVA